jgi:serine/threonine protein phosphatase 1
MGVLNFLKREQAAPVFSLPPLTRIYAIGDVHGCLTQLRDMIEKIERDVRQSPIEQVFLVILGDLIDRGPDSAGVVEYLLNVRARFSNIVFLVGNHEEMFLRALAGDGKAMREWLAYGGDACAESYGIDPADLLAMSGRRAAQELCERVPQAHRDFLASFQDSFKCGDYLFVHAGIRPGVSLRNQKIRDLRWIRDDFTRNPTPLPCRVVHGHSISNEAEEHPYRIGVDTGAYASGTLTAVQIEGAEVKFISSDR